MNDSAELAQLERQLQALQREETQRADAIEETCRARLASPGALLTAGAAGAMLGLLGGSRRAKPDPRQQHVGVDGSTWLGGLLALAGAASALVRILELGALLKTDRHRD